MEQEIKCEILVVNWYFYGNIYTCIIKDQKIGNKSTLKFIGKHKPGKGNNHVLGVFFNNCKIRDFPKGLTKSFPNLQYLAINNSELKNISREDLKEYEKLKVLCLTNNKIAYLPGDLLQDLKQLNVFIAFDSKIEMIEPNIFDNCNDLKHVDLRGNICIDKCLSSISFSSQNATLEEIKEELKFIYPSWGDKVKNFKGEISSEVFKLFKEFQREKIESDKKIEDLQKELTKMKLKFENFETVTKNEELKDFTIKTETEEFKAHKFVLAAKSPTFAKLISENLHAESLNLLDVSTDVFRAILDFMYTSELPENNQINFIELFIASERLKIEKLKIFAAQKLLNKINLENALNLLKLGIKYEQEEIRKKSFEEIKKFLDFEEIDEDLEPEKLEKLIEIKKEKESLMKEMEESVKNILGKK